jgi:hypothetical protein
VVGIVGGGFAWPVRHRPLLIVSRAKELPCLRALSFSYRGVLSAFCAETFVVVSFGW